MIAVKSPLSVSPNSLGPSCSPYSTSPSSPQKASRTSQMSADNPTNAGPAPPTYLSPEVASTDTSKQCSDTSINRSGEITNDEANGDGNAQTAIGESISRSNSALSIRTSGNKAVESETTPDDDQPRSVIHAPLGFRQLRPDDSPHESNSSSQQSDVTIKSPLAVNVNSSDKKSNSPVSPPPLTTHIPPAKDWSDRVTPRAQTRQEVEELKPNPRKSNLEDIPETSDPEVRVEEPEEEWDPAEATIGNFQDTEEELKALRTALDECWTLCNTLASLSYIHRERLFNFSGKGDKQEVAWKCCWKLCQNLYDNRDTDYIIHVRPTLDLCRDFCQALFEVRARDNEAADSVLRVSFELNNHLYNTHDRNLPEAFRERTLDFYITLCHRLMKQRTQLAAETDSLLRACWSLAEMLFSIRQAKREGKRPDEELLGSAVQACWELCDLFREGWTQIRPDRGTPRASQTTFTQAFYQAKRSSEYTTQSNNNNTNNDQLVSHHLAVNPETPTTIFDDTGTMAADEVSVPNIVVLGHTHAPQEQWPSTSSTLSGYSRSSDQTDSSTHTVRSPAEDPNLTCLKLLIVRAAMNSGFQRGGSPNLSSFVKTLSSDSFGNLPWQRTLLENYKKLVVFDPAFRVVAPPARAGALDVGQAVQAMVQHNGQYSWLRDLYRLVFGFRAEDAIHRKSVTVQT